MRIYKVTTSATTELIAKRYTSDGNIKSVLISNTSANDALVDLYLDDADGGTSDPYFFKDVKMPTGSSFVFDSSQLKYDGAKYGLKIQNDGGSPSLTIIIN